jgi:hypothetical protein
MKTANINDIDKRIIDFRNETQTIPQEFIEKIIIRKMIFACGDGYQQPRFGIPNEIQEILDLEAYTNAKQYVNFADLKEDDYDRKYFRNYNIFCCSYNYNEKGLHKNIDYLRNHPELNILLCLFDITNESELTKFSKLFQNSIRFIDTDDIRYYIPSNIAYNILIECGVCYSCSSYANKQYYNNVKFTIISERKYAKVIFPKKAHPKKITKLSSIILSKK